MLKLIIPAIKVMFRKKVTPRIVGFYAGRATRRNPRYGRYVAWQNHVRKSVEDQGVTLPFIWTEQCPALVLTATYFQKPDYYNPDCENVRKSIVDALVYIPKASRTKGSGTGDDRWCSGAHLPPQYDYANPRVDIFIYDKLDIEAYVDHYANLLWEASV